MARKGLIHFRCWYCNRKHSAGWDQVGERRVCGCGQRYRVPRHPDGPSRDKSLLDWVIEFVIYGGGCGLLVFGVSFLIVGRLFIRRLFFWESLVIVGGLTLTAFLLGGLFGERGVNWIGSLMRDMEERN